jgi:hypothetical protein
LGIGPSAKDSFEINQSTLNIDPNFEESVDAVELFFPSSSKTL